ncbi:molybdopterin-synthase adenylyltransferase MoeB [Fervidibacter sacchari]|uniref:molybdopterin-synthase adenylyltransferase MoeB n=1 Tax=Candidatus Fervidibacter sacchari TaxID=1448929 RepID=UPI001763C4FA|nr:molybdopterin-synthase adenylyltransferase MoeB [Candidatus Fervidibacter sacchari]WKU18037.1 molybdopterin-synthase adenylyltransferase MoeB [Candidatus Fervidibacter sacchari]
MAQVRLTNEQILRYSRHLILPEVGMAGQKKLRAASVLIIGAGGLGCPIALYLTAAGIGRLGLVDFDVVDRTNLQRQILYGESVVGVPKVEAAAERLKDLNPDVEIETYPERLTSENALQIMSDYDIIIDGTDNFPTRYLTNDAAVILGKPYIYGSIFRFEGQVSVFLSRPFNGFERGPCYRCLFPSPPPPGAVPSCAEGGVLGVLPGIVGALQAAEAIKLIVGIGEPLIGKLMLIDTLRMEFKTVRIRRNPNCPVCGDNPTIRELIDYEEFCGLRRGELPESDEIFVTPQELKSKLDAGEPLLLLDVREPEELEISEFPHPYKHIPLDDLPERVHELDLTSEIIIFCRNDQRSRLAAQMLQRMGFSRVKVLKGGINAWSQEIDPSVPQY